MAEEKFKALKVDPPESLHTRFKLMCVRQGTNMKARLLELMEADVEEWESLHGPVIPIGEEPAYKNLRQLLLDNLDDLSSNPKISDRIEALMQGEKPTETDRLRIALQLGLSEEYLERLIGQGNGKAEANV